MKKIMFYVVMLAAERKSKTCRNLSNLRYLRAKKSVIILVLTAMAAAGNVMGQRSLTVDCSPSSGNGYTGRATISVWLDENPITVFPYTYFSIRAGVSSSISNVSYVYGGRSYTSAEIPSIGSPRPYQMTCEVGVSYGNSSVIWKRVGLSAVPSDDARVNLSQLGIALPAVTPHPPGFSTPENQAQWEQQRLEHGRTADAHRTAYRSALNSINVQVRNCNCANDTRVDMDIRNKLSETEETPTQQVGAQTETTSERTLYSPSAAGTRQLSEGERVVQQ
ncbi:MAG: hypothetical protein FWH18_02710, partial [Marinilabiliaceae bacterium]|nr:hypothetical protein [Marinilabiliaceae bacterium]